MNYFNSCLGTEDNNYNINNFYTVDYSYQSCAALVSLESAFPVLIPALPNPPEPPYDHYNQRKFISINFHTGLVIRKSIYLEFSHSLQLLRQIWNLLCWVVSILVWFVHYNYYDMFVVWVWERERERERERVFLLWGVNKRRGCPPSTCSRASPAGEHREMTWNKTPPGSNTACSGHQNPQSSPVVWSGTLLGHRLVAWTPIN